MFPLKRIAGFFLPLVIVYVLLAIPWPGLQEAYAAAFRVVGSKLFPSYGPDGAIRFRSIPVSAGMVDLEIDFANRQTDGQALVTHSARLTAYLPTVQVLALILATPIPWSRRWKALLLGLVLVNLFVLFRLWIVVLNIFCSDLPVGVVSLSPFWKAVLNTTYRVGVVWASCSFVVPIFIWILVAIRREDLQRWAVRETVTKAGTGSAHAVKSHRRKRPPT